MVIDDQLKELREVLYKVKGTIDRVEANWDKDRKDFAEFQNRLGHVEVELKTLREQIQQQPARIQDRMGEVAQPIIESTNSLAETIEKKKFYMFTNKDKKHWWKFW